MYKSLLRWHDPRERIRALRLATGLLLFVFVAMHMANHALNLISVHAAEVGRVWFARIWQSPSGTLLLYGSLLVHFILVLRALYVRRTLKMPMREWGQTLLGLAIPLLLIDHVLQTRVHTSLTGLPVTYESVARALWVNNPVAGARQSIALVIAWAHGCVGLYFWLRFRAIYPKIAPFLLIGAVLLPVVALLGFVEAGRAVEVMSRPTPMQFDPVIQARADLIRETLRPALYGGFAASLALVGLLRSVRRFRERKNIVRVRYANGMKVDVPRGSSVLEASRMGGIPHYAVCGGKGRCSTCRVQIVAGLAKLPPPSRAEAATLERIGAGPDVRLACQLRPVHGIKVMPLLVPAHRHEEAEGSVPVSPGREAEIAVLFCDIRSFTALSEARLPFDTVFLLNRYFAIVGNAVERAGGRLDKFVGDGAMALFGPGESVEEACRQALEAAFQIHADLVTLSEELSGELTAPLRVAIGIHSGPAIVGRMGFGPVMSLTAIGDTVNVASRLESVAKRLDAAVVVSQETVALSGIDLSNFETREITIRGRMAKLAIRIVPQGKAPVPAGDAAA